MFKNLLKLKNIVGVDDSLASHIKSLKCKNYYVYKQFYYSNVPEVLITI